MVWFVLAGMAACAVLIALWPLLRPSLSAKADPAANEAAFYKAQLEEIRRDVERGLLPQGEAESARADDDRIIGRLRLRIAPLLRPTGIVLQPLQRDIDKGKPQLTAPLVISRGRLPACDGDCENNFVAAAKLCCWAASPPGASSVDGGRPLG